MPTAVAQGITVTEEALIVDLTDGRTISVPLAWYPRLLHGTPEERNKWRLIGNGEGIQCYIPKSSVCSQRARLKYP